MLFIVCLVVTIIAVIAAFVFERHDYDMASLLAGIVAIPTTFATIIMIIALLITYVGVPGTEAKWQEQYASLNTRIENHMYNAFNKGELIKEVQDWNTDFAAQKISHNNLWVGIFNPESIDGLDKIDLNRIN